MNSDTWLTLAQLARKADLSEAAVLRLVDQLGHWLGGRNFGDIVKYPAAVTEAMTIIFDLCRQGWSLEEIKEILPQDGRTQAQEDRTLDQDFTGETIAPLATSEHMSQLLLFAIRVANNLLSTNAILVQRLADMKTKMESLERENQIIRRVIEKN